VLLQIEALRKSFRDPDGETLPVVDVPAFSLDEGEQVGLRGTSGSGKTTFLHCIAGILRADAGSIRFDGEDLSRWPEARRDRFRARHIGYVYQSFHLLPGYTALENVLVGMMFGEGIDRARAVRTLESLGLGSRLDHRPRQLSIGQQQRVALARALVNRPRLLLADEPTGNLDPAHAGTALERIRESCREVGAALLIVSHDPALLAGFERVEEWSALNRAFDHAAGAGAPEGGADA
jgi:putative ABC transport system ATP-binding protein